LRSNLIFGNPNNIEEGAIYPSRGALMDDDLHRSNMKGIDGNGTEGAAAIVLSGGYEDDYDNGNEILYTGEGGNNTRTGKQVAHQSWNSPGNAGLLKSYQDKLPIRVIRGYNHNSPYSPKEGYKYCGLYRIIEEPFMQIGKSGFKICRFKLRKLGTELEKVEIVAIGSIVTTSYGEGKVMLFSIGIKDSKSRELNPESKLVQELIGKKVGDKIELGPGYQITQIVQAKS
jgi:hypothetical protein